MNVKMIINYAVCIFCVLINLGSIFILMISNRLKKSRFHALVLFLSISDLCIAFLIIVLLSLQSINSGEPVTLYGCMILKHLAGGMLGFSLIQILLICFERLQATFTTKLTAIKKLTSKTAVSVYFVVCQLYTLIPLSYEVINGPRQYGCSVFYTLNKLYVITLDIPLLGTMCAILVLYIIIIYRITIQKNRFLRQHFGSNSTNQTRKRKEELNRMKLNMTTLGMIIALTSVSIVPREIVAICSLFQEIPESELIKITHSLLLLNPLFDPLIYVLRIPEVKNKITAICSKQSMVSPEESGITRVLPKTGIQNSSDGISSTQ